MSFGQSIRRGTQWLLVGSAGQQVLSFLVGIVLARLLLPSDFGLITTVQIFTGLAGLFASGGMGQALVQSKEVSEEDVATVFTMQLAVGLVIYGGFFAIAPWFARWFGEAIYADLLRVSALSFLIRPFANIPNRLLQREMRFKASTIVSFLGLVTTSCLSVGMALTGYGVWSLTFSGLIAAFLTACVLAPIAKWRPRISFNRLSARRFASFGFLASASDLLVYVQQQTSQLLVSRALGPAAIGLYNKGSSLAMTPAVLLSGSVYQPVFRALAASQDSQDRAKYIFYRTITLDTLYTLPCYVLLFWIAEPFVLFVYGEKWRQAAVPLAILALCGPFISIEMHSGGLIAAWSRLAEEVRVHFVCWIILIVACLLGLRFGLAGVACAMLAVSILRSTALFRVAARCVSSGPGDLFRAIRPSLGLALIMFAIMFATELALIAWGRPLGPLAHVAVQTCLGLGSYGIAFFGLRIAAFDAERERWLAVARKLLSNGS